jgi:F-BAR domain only protein
MRGRRDVRNTIFVPNPEPPLPDNEPSTISESTLSAASGISAPGATSTGAAVAPYADQSTASPIKAPATIQEERTLSDTTSIHSAQSLGTMVHHPEMHEPGLNASVIETVSTWFSDGTVSKSFVIGEVALAYNGSQPTAASEMVRLDNFQVLEKIAPNPSFVSTAPASAKGKEKATGTEEVAGQYSVSLSAIKRSTPVVAFKYQLHLDPANLSVYSPVLLTPAWQIQDTQVSVIVMYSLNPAFVVSGSESPSSTTTSMTLRNFTLSIALDSSADAGKANSAMMAPQNGAAFKRKQGLVVWKLPEMVVSTEQQKLLARFITTGPKARPGPIEAKWELPGTTGSKLGVSMLGGGAGTSSEAAADPFADDGTTPAVDSGKLWNEVYTARSLISGRYSAS